MAGQASAAERECDAGLRGDLGILIATAAAAECSVAKRQVTLRLDPDVIDRFRAEGPGWQGWMNAALRKAVGL